MRHEIAFCLFAMAIAPVVAFGQPKFTVTGDPVNVAPGGTGTVKIKVKYECNGCTTTYSGGWELFEGVSSGFELVGHPTFACDPGPACTVTTTPNCIVPDPEFGQLGCFGQATLAPGAVVSEIQTIKQQPGGRRRANAICT